jgi:hypothetical protein
MDARDGLRALSTGGKWKKFGLLIAGSSELQYGLKIYSAVVEPVRNLAINRCAS